MATRGLIPIFSALNTNYSSNFDRPGKRCQRKSPLQVTRDLIPKQTATEKGRSNLTLSMLVIRTVVAAKAQLAIQ